MKWYLYLNYRIYNYYNKRQDIPIFSSLLVISLLIFTNIFSIHTIYLFITDFWTVPKLNPEYKIIITVFMTFLLILHYFLLYHKDKYVNIFKEFEENTNKYNNWNLSIKFYIIGSFILCLIILVIADLRNHNFELYFLK